MDAGKISSPSTTRYIYFVDSRDPLTTGGDKTGKVRVDFDGLITEVRADISTAPTGAALIGDINLNGSTIWSTQENRITIADGAIEGSQTTFDTSVVAAGDYLTFDIDQIGSTVEGSKIAVRVKITLT